VLKVAEYNRLREEARKANIQGPKLSDVREIEPLSDEMKEWMPIQWRIYKDRREKWTSRGDCRREAGKLNEY
jgi:hypothetical protein